MPEETETAKQIKGALGGIAEGLAAAFAPKKAPPKPMSVRVSDSRRRPVLPMKGSTDPTLRRPTIPMKYVEEGTEGQWDDPEPSWKDEEDSEYRVHPAGRYGGSTRSKGSRQELDAGHQHEGHTALRKALQQDLRESTEAVYIEGVPKAR